MTYAVNDIELFEAVVVLPRTGAWFADLRVDGADADALIGTVSIDLDGMPLSGTVRRSGSSADLQHVRVVGGAGGLSTQLQPRHYRQVPASAVVSDLLSAGGETLASDSTGLDVSLPHWTVLSGRLSEALDLITVQLGLVWRVKTDGTVWLGVESWQTVTLDVSAELVSEQLDEGRRVYGVDSPSLLPGTVVDGWQLASVQHSCSERGIRTTVWREESDVSG